MERKDRIYHTTRTKPKFRDRIKILFGATIVVDSIIKVDKDVEVEFSTARDTCKFKS